MSLNDSNLSTDRPSAHSGALWVLSIGLALALAGNVFQFVKQEHLSRDMALKQTNAEKEISDLTQAAANAAETNQQRFDALKSQIEGVSAATLSQARSEVKRSSSQLAQSLERKQKEVASQLSDLKQDTSAKLQDTSAKLQDTSTKLEDTSNKLQDTNVKLDQVSSDVEKTGSDLKRVVGDMGVMSGDIATNAKELATLKELGERNYFEFDLSKTKAPQKIGDIRVALKKTDAKHNRFTMEVFADDKTVEKKDRTINEPVQLYVAGNRQPYEIVVNQVYKDRIVGYVSVPKKKEERPVPAKASSAE
jgi:myosin heavy subunit